MRRTLAITAGTCWALLGVVEVLLAGEGGYTMRGFETRSSGKQTITVSYTVAGHTRTASFEVVGAQP